MPYNVVEQHSVSAPWSAGGNIYIQLGPKPYTITRMVLRVSLTVSTGVTPGTFSDPWDRVISSLQLTSAGYTYFDFRDMRLARHMGRFSGYQVRTPGGLAASVTNATVNFAYNIHFGVSPLRIDLNDGVPRDNPWDLTAGIPARDQTLILVGTWGGANAPGSGYTISSGSLTVTLFGVQPKEGEDPAAFRPRARPKFFTDTVVEAGTSGIFAKSYNVPVGDYLHSTLIMTTAGANDDRTLGVLNSFQADIIPLNLWFMRFLDDDNLALASQLTQLGEDGWPPADDPSAPGTLLIGAYADPGLYLVDFKAASRTGHPLYGFDLNLAQVGDVLLRYGVSAAGTIRFLHRKYVLVS